MGRLIDADICLDKAWQNFYKQEDEHEKNIDGYDIMRDQFYEQSGFECCQQAIVNAPTVEAIPKADYEARLKADMVAMFTELQKEILELPVHVVSNELIMHIEIPPSAKDVYDVIQEKIKVLKENT